MAEGQTDEGFHVLTPWCPRRAGLPGRGTAFFPKESGGKERPGASPTLDPPVRGLMAAVRCTDRAKTGRALPPAPLAGACGNWGPRRSPAKRVRWGEEAQRRE